MDSSPDTALSAAGPSGATVFADRRAALDGFVGRHFTWPGTFRIHRAALGWDILRAPVNVLLSLVLVLTRLAALVCRLLRRPGWSGWLLSRRILLRTAVARRVETLVLTDLLGLPDLPEDIPALAATPQFRAMTGPEMTAAGAERTARRLLRDVAEYAGARTAVAELTTTLCVILAGALVFHALTPGMISMAPDVAGAVARTTAIAEFPLGKRLGGAWYGLMTPDTPAWLVGAAVTGLVAAGAVFAAFAGVLADPVQAWLGIHRRRLRRLLDTLEAHCRPGADRPFVAREHLLARVLDLWDAALSLFRLLRG